MLVKKAWISISIPVYPEGVIKAEARALTVHHTKLIKPHLNGGSVNRNKVILDLPKTGSTQLF